MSFKILISNEAREDIQQAISWYNDQQKGLGSKFHREVKDRFKVLRYNPFFAIRYDNVRCYKLKKFPYLIHFIVDESQKIITILGIINTSQNPETNWFFQK